MVATLVDHGRKRIRSWSRPWSTMLVIPVVHDRHLIRPCSLADPIMMVSLCDQASEPAAQGRYHTRPCRGSYASMTTSKVTYAHHPVRSCSSYDLSSTGIGFVPGPGQDVPTRQTDDGPEAHDSDPSAKVSRSLWVLARERAVHGHGALPPLAPAGWSLGDGRDAEGHVSRRLGQDSEKPERAPVPPASIRACG
jgi:hypothetical protein